MDDMAAGVGSEILPQAAFIFQKHRSQRRNDVLCGPAPPGVSAPSQGFKLLKQETESQVPLHPPFSCGLPLQNAVLIQAVRVWPVCLHF